MLIGVRMFFRCSVYKEGKVTNFGNRGQAFASGVLGGV